MVQVVKPRHTGTQNKCLQVCILAEIGTDEQIFVTTQGATGMASGLSKTRDGDDGGGSYLECAGHWTKW